MNISLVEEIFNRKYSGKCPHLCKDTITDFTINTIKLLFPQLSQTHYCSQDELKEAFTELKEKLNYIFKCIEKETSSNNLDSDKIVNGFFEKLLKIEQQLSADAKFIADEDPSSTGINEVILCYPGFYAIAVYRIANYFYKNNVPLLPRIISEYAHQLTGIDIHPGATIGSPFFIDHGTGIVIGETTIIGNNCKVFQGVTLGALSVKKKYKSVKRHPTIEDNCLIYSNTTILGGDTTIGKNTVIGGNTWITKSIAENSQVYHNHNFKITSK